MHTSSEFNGEWATFDTGDAGVLVSDAISPSDACNMLLLKGRSDGDIDWRAVVRFRRARRRGRKPCLPPLKIPRGGSDGLVRSDKSKSFGRI